MRTPNKSNQNQKPKYQERRDLIVCNHLVCSLREIGKDVLFGCESTNSRTGRPVNGPPFSQSCVPVCVERVDKDQDADENVDTDQISTGRLVKSRQPTGLFTNFTNLFLLFSFLLQLDRLQLTSVCCNRRGGVKTTPQKTRFRSVNRLQGIHIQVKSEYVGTFVNTETDVVKTTPQKDQFSQCESLQTGQKLSKLLQRQ